MDFDHIVGASPEVMAHHIARHACGPDVPIVQMLCRCGQTALGVCDTCDTPVMIATKGSVACMHARSALDPHTLWSAEHWRRLADGEALP